MTALKSYTVEEIDAMRYWIRQIIFAQYHPINFNSLYHAPVTCVINVEAEDQLRTYMINGTSPKELEEKFRSLNRSEMNMTYHE